MRTDGCSSAAEEEEEEEESDEGKRRSRTREEEAVARIDADKKNLKSTSLSCLGSNMSRAQPSFRRRGRPSATTLRPHLEHFVRKTFEKKKKREGERFLACLPDDSREPDATRSDVNDH